jgi:hypothetical protein
MTTTFQTEPRPSPLYLVLCGQHIDEYAAERDVNDMDRETTIRDIAAGEFETLSRVIEIGTGADVTKDFARQVMTIWAGRGETLSYRQYEFVEIHVGTRAARSFLRRAA